MDNNDLFPQAVGLSPKLAWMARHDVVTCANSKGRWFAILTCETVGEAETEDDALVDLCLRSGIKHWNLK